MNVKLQSISLPPQAGLPGKKAPTYTDHDWQMVTAIKKWLVEHEMSRAWLPTTTIRYFDFQHLPQHLQAVSRPVGELAQLLEAQLPDGPEKSAGMRKLLEAKDCFVRAALTPPKVLLCGVDCQQGDARCNGYCTGNADRPPRA